jgi:hypothetical protein
MNEKVIIITRPNSDDSDQTLIVTIDLDLRNGRTISANFPSHYSQILKLSIWISIVAVLELHCRSHVNQNLEPSELTHSFVG